MNPNDAPSRKQRATERNDAQSRLQSVVWLVALIVGVMLLAWLLTRQLSNTLPPSIPVPGIGQTGQGPRSPHIASTSNTQGLPAEAVEVMRKIQAGEQLPYRRDGVVFENREQRLPQKPRGYYHEYTVTTPGAQNRGTRRIITGGNPPEVWYYSADHYRTFTEVSP